MPAMTHLEYPQKKCRVPHPWRSFIAARVGSHNPQPTGLVEALFSSHACSILTGSVPRRPTFPHSKLELRQAAGCSQPSLLRPQTAQTPKSAQSILPKNRRKRCAYLCIFPAICRLYNAQTDKTLSYSRHSPKAASAPPSLTHTGCLWSTFLNDMYAACANPSLCATWCRAVSIPPAKRIMHHIQCAGSGA